MPRVNGVLPRCCPTCRKEFTPRRSRVVFCSKRCKSLAQHGLPADAQRQKVYHGDCRHCRRTTELSARGLCYPCYRDPVIRPQYGRSPTGRSSQEWARINRPARRAVFVAGIETLAKSLTAALEQAEGRHGCQC